MQKYSLPLSILFFLIAAYILVADHYYRRYYYFCFALLLGINFLVVWYRHLHGDDTERQEESVSLGEDFRVVDVTITKLYMGANQSSTARWDCRIADDYGNELSGTIKVIPHETYKGSHALIFYDPSTGEPELVTDYQLTDENINSPG